MKEVCNNHVSRYIYFINKFRVVLSFLRFSVSQQLFDPISPDKDTIATRQYSRDDRLDSEFWLMQRLSHVMEKANFHELTDVEVKAKLKDKESGSGLKVCLYVKLSSKWSFILFCVSSSKYKPISVLQKLCLLKGWF